MATSRGANEGGRPLASRSPSDCLPEEAGALWASSDWLLLGTNHLDCVLRLRLSRASVVSGEILDMALWGSVWGTSRADVGQPNLLRPASYSSHRNVGSQLRVTRSAPLLFPTSRLFGPLSPIYPLITAVRWSAVKESLRLEPWPSAGHLGSSRRVTTRAS